MPHRTQIKSSGASKSLLIRLRTRSLIVSSVKGPTSSDVAVLASGWSSLHEVQPSCVEEEHKSECEEGSRRCRDKDFWTR